MKSPDNDNDDMKVVLEQTLQKTEEVFVYQIPPMMTSGGHHADDWDLANPVATCSLHVLRRDSSLLIKLLADKPKINGPPGSTEQHLFAQSHIAIGGGSGSGSGGGDDKTKLKIDYWVEAVTDSSRYFVIRISDEKRKKEAHIGIGFRERNDALNFKMSLQDYENTMRKEAIAENENDVTSTDDDTDDNVGGSTNSEQNGIDSAEAAVSKLSLKEGEKIHINFKGGSSTKDRTKKSTSQTSTGSGSKPPMLLRKPPPPASSSGGAPTIVLNTDALRLTNSVDRSGNFDSSSVAAVAETTEIDEDEWGDFESPSFDAE